MEATDEPVDAVLLIPNVLVAAVDGFDANESRVVDVENTSSEANDAKDCDVPFVAPFDDVNDALALEGKRLFEGRLPSLNKSKPL